MNNFNNEIEGLKLDFIKSFRYLNWRIIIGNACWDFLKTISATVTFSGLIEVLNGNGFVDWYVYIAFGLFFGLVQGGMAFSNELKKPLQPKLENKEVEVIRTGTTSYEIRRKQNTLSKILSITKYFEYNYITI